MRNRKLNFYMVKYFTFDFCLASCFSDGAAVVQLPLVPICVTVGCRKGIRHKLVPCASKSPTWVGMSKPFSERVNDVESGRFERVLTPGKARFLTGFRKKNRKPVLLANQECQSTRRNYGQIWSEVFSSFLCHCWLQKNWVFVF